MTPGMRALMAYIHPDLYRAYPGVDLVVVGGRIRFSRSAAYDGYHYVSTHTSHNPADVAGGYVGPIGAVGIYAHTTWVKPWSCQYTGAHSRQGLRVSQSAVERRSYVASRNCGQLATVRRAWPSTKPIPWRCLA